MSKMNSISLIAKKEVKRKFFPSLVIGIIFGSLSALAGSIFWQRIPIISFGISVVVLNFTLFLLGANIISQEKSNDTLSFLLTLPLRDIEIILGKLIGLMIIISPAILINTIVINFISFGRDNLDFIFNFGFNSNFSHSIDYLFGIFLYLLFSASVLILSSSQLRRLPAIFMGFMFYHIVLAIPGTYWFLKINLISVNAFVFFTFLIIFSFFTPFVFGLSEIISQKMLLLAPLLLRMGGQETILTIFEKLPEDSAFYIINLFCPLWHSSILSLKSSEFFQISPFTTPISFFSIILTVVILNILASFQLRQKTQIIAAIYLSIALIPCAFGLFLY